MTTEDRANTIISNESGYRKDLRDAEQLIIVAGNDPTKLAMAFQRHAEAVRNMMIAEMLPSFSKALKPLLDDSLTPVIAGIGGLQLGQNQLNSSFQSISDIVNQLVGDMSDSQRDRASIHREIAELKEQIATLQSKLDNAS